MKNSDLLRKDTDKLIVMESLTPELSNPKYIEFCESIVQGLREQGMNTSEIRSWIQSGLSQQDKDFVGELTDSLKKVNQSIK